MSQFVEYTDHVIKEQINDIPGIGNVKKRFVFTASLEKSAIKEMNTNFGIDVEEMTKNALRNECSLNLCKTLLNQLNAITPQEYTLEDALLQLNQAENLEIIVTKKVLYKLHELDLIAPFVEGTTNKHIPIIVLSGSIGNIKVYLDTYTNDSATSGSLFVVRENIVSLLSASDGISTDDKNVKYLIEGHYIISQSDKNQHFKIS